MTDIELKNRIEKQSQLFIRRAVIYDNMNYKSDMLRVRPIPDMLGFAEEDLPCYPPFNPTTILKGVSEKQAGTVDKATQIWIICTDDYRVGWVFGEANQQYATEATKVEDPWAFNKFKTHLLRQHIGPSKAAYKEMKVLFSNARYVNAYDNAGISGASTTAITIDAVNVRTGERWIMLQSGTSIAIMQDQINLRVGSPDKGPSSICIKPKSIDIIADNIQLYGRKATSLGKHGMQAVGMLGAATAVDGSPLVPLLDITC